MHENVKSDIEKSLQSFINEPCNENTLNAIKNSIHNFLGDSAKENVEYVRYEGEGRYSLNARECAKAMFPAQFSTATAKSIIVLEEIDTIFENREKTVNNSLTLGGLLNSLDGIVAKEGRIVVMTTNHPERLDPALTRPGRIDKTIHFGKATLDQIERMLMKFFPEENIYKIAKTINSKPDGNSMAELQELCIKYRDNFEELKRIYE